MSDPEFIETFFMKEMCLKRVFNSDSERTLQKNRCKVTFRSSFSMSYTSCTHYFYFFNTKPTEFCEKKMYKKCKLIVLFFYSVY